MTDAAKDREECAQQLLGLATCLFFSFSFNYCYFDIVENYLNLWTISLASSGGSSSNAKNKGISTQDKNKGCYGPKRWFGMQL